MKTFRMSVIVAVVLGMAIPAMGPPPTQPPPGEHYTFNCVTAWSGFSGTITITYDNAAPFTIPDVAALTGDLNMSLNEGTGVLTDADGTLVLTPVPVVAGAFTIDTGTGIYAGWYIEGTIAEDVPLTVDNLNGTSTDTYILAGHIEKPHEILVPFDGSGMLGIQEGSPFEITDNDMTDGQAWVQIPEGSYDTYDQARGKPGGEMFWGNFHARATKKPVWAQHNDPLPIGSGYSGNWAYTNDGVTCYSFRLYPLP